VSAIAVLPRNYRAGYRTQDVLPQVKAIDWVNCQAFGFVKHNA
jgi:hypothetical protein